MFKACQAQFESRGHDIRVLNLEFLNTIGYKEGQFTSLKCEIHNKSLTVIKQ